MFCALSSLASSRWWRAPVFGDDGVVWQVAHVPYEFACAAAVRALGSTPSATDRFASLSSHWFATRKCRQGPTIRDHSGDTPLAKKTKNNKRPFRKLSRSCSCCSCCSLVWLMRESASVIRAQNQPQRHQPQKPWICFGHVKFLGFDMNVRVWEGLGVDLRQSTDALPLHHTTRTAHTYTHPHTPPPALLCLSVFGCALDDS